jgi:hypothetical protein
MKTLQFTYSWLPFFLILSGWINTAQAQPDIKPEEARKLVEKVMLITDRETYCVDEDILFSAFNVSSVDMHSTDWSNVLYIELISPDGEAFVSAKFALTNDGTSGSLPIPRTVLTGNYYLRAYTRWMRNYSPNCFFYKMIKVINPFRAELLEPRVEKIAEESEVKSTPENSNDLHIKVVNSSIQKRESVNIEISASNPAEFSEIFTVSVVAKGTEMQLIPKLPEVEELRFSPEFIPETRGLSISGQVVNATDSVPIPYSLVGLTIFKENPELRNVLTNEKGRFYFDLSKTEGQYDIFISANWRENQSPLILVDNDFSTKNLSLPFVAVDLSEQSLHQYQTLMFNSQIKSLFRTPQMEEKNNSFKSDSVFYGKPEFVIRIADYISMPTIKDYFSELIPQVGIRHVGNKTKLKVHGEYSDLAVYDPLILVDMVSIFDIDKIFTLQPSKIDRIEVVTRPYLRGDIMFGGIISIFSKNKDLGGIDLPSSGRFITYNMLNHGLSKVIPVIQNNRTPNLSNCLYWDPKLKMLGSEPTKITFSAGDCAGDYLTIVRGIDKEGKIKVATASFSVKE